MSKKVSAQASALFLSSLFAFSTACVTPVAFAGLTYQPSLEQSYQPEAKTEPMDTAAEKINWEDQLLGGADVDTDEAAEANTKLDVLVSLMPIAPFQDAVVQQHLKETLSAEDEILSTTMIEELPDNDIEGFQETPETHTRPFNRPSLDFKSFFTPSRLKSLKGFKFIVPLEKYKLTSRFGMRWGRAHTGIDLSAPIGSPIYASASGKVAFSGWYGGYGKNVVIDHGNGYKTRYAHCSVLLVNEGQDIRQGQLVGLVGNTGHSTGPHVHFEVIADGVYKNPEAFLKRRTTAFKPVAASSVVGNKNATR